MKDDKDKSPKKYIVIVGIAYNNGTWSVHTYQDIKAVSPDDAWNGVKRHISEILELVIHSWVISCFPDPTERIEHDHSYESCEP